MSAAPDGRSGDGGAGLAGRPFHVYHAHYEPSVWDVAHRRPNIVNPDTNRCSECPPECPVAGGDDERIVYDDINDCLASLADALTIYGAPRSFTDPPNTFTYPDAPSGNSAPRVLDHGWGDRRRESELVKSRRLRGRRGLVLLRAGVSRLARNLGRQLVRTWRRGRYV